MKNNINLNLNAFVMEGRTTYILFGVDDTQLTCQFRPQQDAIFIGPGCRIVRHPSAPHLKSKDSSMVFWLIRCFTVSKFNHNEKARIG